MTSRFALKFALVALPILGMAPSAYADETSDPTSTMAPAPAQEVETQSEVEKGEKPHVGEATHDNQRNGNEDFKEHGIFHDEEAIVALGGAFVLGAGLAYMVLRRKKREEI
jgi:hypothetical protein